LDTSCLLKLLWEEPESRDVRNAVHSEDQIVVSSLTELETEVQLKAAALGGEIRSGQLRRHQAMLSAMRNLDPFNFLPVPAAVFSAALRQHRRPDSIYCRAMDRLHLAAMEEMKCTQLMTLDETQGYAARALNYRALRPGRD
jgi:predicted nucleic acid-binding protein